MKSLQGTNAGRLADFIWCVLKSISASSNSASCHKQRWLHGARLAFQRLTTRVRM